MKINKEQLKALILEEMNAIEEQEVPPVIQAPKAAPAAPKKTTDTAPTTETGIVGSILSKTKTLTKADEYKEVLKATLAHVGGAITPQEKIKIFNEIFGDQFGRRVHGIIHQVKE